MVWGGQVVAQMLGFWLVRLGLGVLLIIVDRVLQLRTQKSILLISGKQQQTLDFSIFLEKLFNQHKKQKLNKGITAPSQVLFQSN